MRYNNLCTFPHERTRVTFPWVFWDNAFSHEEIDKIVDQCAGDGTECATTLGSDENKKVRVSGVKFHRWSADNDWIFQRLLDVVATINNRWYGFELNGWDAFQYTEYRGDEAGKYDWHMDLCLGTDCLPAEMIEPRKLSLSLLLGEPGSDFVGGDFQFNLGNEAEARTAECRKGRIIAFPSWVIHRVTPVTEGTRRSLVVWVTGPKFS